MKQVLEKIDRSVLGMLKRCVPPMHGYYLMLLANRAGVQEFRHTLNHSFLLSENPKLNCAGRCYFDALPVRQNAIDCVLLHHVLDEVESPHKCLREAVDIVVPNGYLVVVGYNPWSLLGLWRRWRMRSCTELGCQQISAARLQDWLTLLDFRVEKTEFGVFHLPVPMGFLGRPLSWFGRLLSWGHLPTGGVYVIVARKQVAGTTLIRPKWRPLRSRELPVVAPTVREASVRSR